MLAPLALACSAALGGFHGTVWVVDDDGGAGVDFTELQPAVDAASEGDAAWEGSACGTSSTIFQLSSGSIWNSSSSSGCDVRS